MNHYVTLIFAIPSAVNERGAIAAAKLVCCTRSGVAEFLVSASDTSVEPDGCITNPPVANPDWRKRLRRHKN
jgi:hypothetical protein